MLRFCCQIFVRLWHALSLSQAHTLSLFLSLTPLSLSLSLCLLLSLSFALLSVCQSTCCLKWLHDFFSRHRQFICKGFYFIITRISEAPIALWHEILWRKWQLIKITTYFFQRAFLESAPISSLPRFFVNAKSASTAACSLLRRGCIEDINRSSDISSSCFVVTTLFWGCTQ